jgi:hypothetical protein
MRRYCRLPVFGGPRGRFAKRPPELVVKHRSRHGGNLGLCQSGGWRITIYIRPGYDRYDAMETLLHELAHAYGHRTGKAYGHGLDWKRLFRRAANEAWDIRRHPRAAHHNTYSHDLRERAKAP